MTERFLTAGRAQAFALLLFAAVLWGGTFVVTKGLLENMAPFTIMTVRFTVAFALLYPIARRRGLRLRGLLDRQVVSFAFTGMVLHLALETTGLRFTTASSAALVIAATPAVTGLAAYMMIKERLAGRQVAAMGLSVVGALIVTGATYAGGLRALIGNVLVLGGVVAWGVYTLQAQKFSKTHTALYATTAALGVAAVMSAPVAAFELRAEGLGEIGVQAVASLLYLGIGASALAFLAWNAAVAQVTAGTAAPFVNLVPVIGVLLGVMTGESISPPQLAGGALVALGLWLGSTRAAAGQGNTARRTLMARPTNQAIRETIEMGSMNPINTMKPPSDRIPTSRAVAHASARTPGSLP